MSERCGSCMHGWHWPGACSSPSEFRCECGDRWKAAVEAAVRADQIKRDIEKVMGATLNPDRTGPRTQIVAVLAAQLNEGNTNE